MSATIPQAKACHPRITVTGADERTPIEELARLTGLSPWVEIGLLYTQTPEGRHRYPRTGWLMDAAGELRGRCAIHVCGGGARKIAADGLDWLHDANRIQVNGAVSMGELRRFCSVYDRIITQHNGGNAQLLDEEAYSHHELLIDASGGRGISPACWLPPVTNKPVGFAGGLGPHNLTEQLPLIKTMSRPGWWVDMEGRIRTEKDWFSVELAERAIEQFVDFVSGRAGGAA